MRRDGKHPPGMTEDHPLYTVTVVCDGPGCRGRLHYHPVDLPEMLLMPRENNAWQLIDGHYCPFHRTD